MSKIEELQRVLKKYQRGGKGYYMACCPAHDDSNPSLSFKENDDGSLYLNCFAGCPRSEIVDALRGLGVDVKTNAQSSYCSFDPNFVEFIQLKSDITMEAAYPYYDSDGMFLGGVVRYFGAEAKKKFKIFTPQKTENGIELKPMGIPEPRPLFGLDILAEAPEEKPVLLVEGEKAAVAARALPECADFIVMTWMGGVNGVNKADWAPLIGRNIVIWPDNDQPGKKAAENIKRKLEYEGASSVSVVKLPLGLPEKFDLADPIPEGIDVAKLLSATMPKTGALADQFLSISELMALDIPEREEVVSPFILSSSLSMLFAVRGLGKTWTALEMGLAVAKGEPFLCYDVPEKRNVLYIDGEMGLADIKGRLKDLGAERVEGFYVLSSEKLDNESRSLNINNEEDQERVLEALAEFQRRGIRINFIIFDNLSSLSAGVDENDNNEIESLLQWLIQLRRLGYAVLLVHHAGKSGDQRGASRREDLLDTVIKLAKGEEKDGEHVQGAHFKLTFTKTRGMTPTPSELDVRLITGPDGNLVFSHANVAHVTPELKTLKYIEQNKPKTQKELADKLGLAEGTVSGHCKKLKDRRFLTGAGLNVTKKGIERLIKTFPREFSVELLHEELPF